jgi:two-component system sensor histidine kinase KdpD
VPPVTAEDAALSADRIRIWQAPVDKETAMHLLVDACLPAAPARQDDAWQALLERELQGVTFVGEDVAIPHARLAGLDRPLVGLGLAADGIHDRVSGQSARIMFLLLSPDDPPRVHLGMLGLLSRLAQDDQWRRAVLAARIPADAERVMRSWAARLANGGG